MDYTEKWKAERTRAAFLALDDGTVFHGVAFGAKKEALGEVVFNTGMGISSPKFHSGTFHLSFITNTNHS